MSDTTNEPIPMGPLQCDVLLRPDDLHEDAVPMPANMGTWERVPGRTRLRRWSFRASAEGIKTSEWLIAVSAAANESLAVYGSNKDTRSNCLRGVYRDAFAAGVQWADDRGETVEVSGGIGIHVQGEGTTRVKTVKVTNGVGIKIG